MFKEVKSKAIVLNFGCSANRAISEGLAGILKSNGYILEDSTNNADLIIVNTCIVKQNTEHRMKSLLSSLPTDREVIITGCLPSVMLDWVNENVPRAHILFPEQASELISLIGKKQKSMNENQKILSKWDWIYTRERSLINPNITAVEISRGCLGNCSYCIVKHVKGDLRSRSPISIISEIEHLVKNGSKEIWLTSQDTGIYGWDLTPSIFLPDLINDITKIQNDFKIRLGMMTPYTVQRFSDQLISQINHPKVFSFLHLPIQSGSNKILNAMKRKETREYFVKLIKKLRKNISNLVIATDIIVGFPNETEEDYLLSESLIKELTPTIVNISKYTDRPGTDAARMKRKIPSKIKASRSKRLTEICKEISRSQLKTWIGWKGNVIIDDVGKEKTQVKGRNNSYLPVVISNATNTIGTIQEVIITDSTTNFLIGEIIN
jgi:MiaB-like tRNA modifying enzyme